MHAPRLSALIRGPVAKEAAATPVLRPASGRAGSDVRSAETAAAEPLAAPLRRDARGSEPVAAKAMPVHSNGGRPEPVRLMQSEPHTPLHPQRQTGTNPVAQPASSRVSAPDVSRLPSPVARPEFNAPRGGAPESALVRNAGPGLAASALGPSIRHHVGVEPPQAAADAVQVERLRHKAAPLLPRDPERLAASAARLGLLAAPPAMPTGSDFAPAVLPAVRREPVVKPALPSPVGIRPDAKKPVPRVAKPGAERAVDSAAKPAPQAAIMPNPAAAPDPVVKPPLTAPAVVNSAPPALRPAGRQAEQLPSSPPQAEPRVRVMIGRVTLVAPKAKGQDSDVAGRKSVLAPVTGRAARGHSIPRPGGQ